MEKKNEKETDELDKIENEVASYLDTKKGKSLRVYIVLGCVFMILGFLTSLFQVYAGYNELNLGNYELVFYIGDWFYDLGFACLFLFFVDYVFNNYDYKKLRRINETDKKDLIHLDNILEFLSKIVLIGLAGLFVAYLNESKIIIRLSSDILCLITLILILIVSVKLVYLLIVNTQKNK